LKEITIQFEDGTEGQYPQGISLQMLITQRPPQAPPPLVAIVNGLLHELDYKLYTDSKVTWLTFLTPGGRRVYRRSLIFVMQIAAQRLFPQYRLHVYHSLESSIYCQLKPMENKLPVISEKDISALTEEMHKIVTEDLPVKRDVLSQEDAVSFYKAQDEPDKAELIALRQSAYLNLYTCGEVTDYLFGRMVTHTALLEDFSLQPFDKGFVLRLPTEEHPPKDSTFPQPNQLQAAMRSYADWTDLLEINNINKLNHVIESDKLTELVLIAETLQERMLHKISDSLYALFPQVRVVMIAGPSSSGKTTFTQRLAIQFRTLGIKPITISLDDYFFNREDAPIDKEGHADFEGLSVLDLSLFNQHINQLLEGKEVFLPHYDFISGRRTDQGSPCSLEENQILLIEGIHALNDALTSGIPTKALRKIYISSLTQINLDNLTPISTTDSRLFRRMVRDMQFRSHTPEQTILRWPSVRNGETQYIFPYQETADFFFNSALIYELPVLRPMIEAELAKIPLESPAYLEAKRLLRIIQYFTPAETHSIPKNSLLQEFLGKSCFYEM